VENCFSQRAVFNYCGLTLGSNFSSEDSCKEKKLDFTVRLLPPQEQSLAQHNWLFDAVGLDDRPWLSVAAQPESYLLRFHGLAEFCIRSNGWIECQPHPGTPCETINHLLLDHVLPRVLAQRGRVVLHGGAVQTARGAIAILGESGWGKSTLVAALAQAGCRLLTDDCLVLDEDNGQFYGLPSYPTLRLWSDSVDSLFGTGHPTLPVAHYTGKRRLDLTANRCAQSAEAVPLWRVYALSSPEEATQTTTMLIEPLTGRAAVMKLAESTFLLDPSDHSLLTKIFRDFGQIAASVTMRKLTVPRDYSLLPAVCATLLAE
jgi:energy-coupling factor transporter ATP-binding protein EcfA2